MLLRESGKKEHGGVDLKAINGQGELEALPHGALLVRFAEAAHESDAEVSDIAAELRSTVGDAGYVEAAGTVAIFNGLVRTADATGIPLDQGTFSVTVSERSTLGVDSYGSARNTRIDTPVSGVDPSNVAGVFR